MFYLVQRTSGCDNHHIDNGENPLLHWLIVLRYFKDMPVAENKQYLIHTK